MPTMRVVIVGAGISGLTLARLLKHRGLPATIYERDTAQRFASRHGYGITLEAHQSLPEILGLGSLNDFRKKIAVDTDNGGTGHVGGQNRPRSTTRFRANRQKFERLLSDGLDIRWGHKLIDIRPKAADKEGQGVQLRFENDHQADADVVVGADGVHSQVRKAISPSNDFKILPFAVYNGKRKISRSIFDERYAQQLGSSTIAEQNVGDAHLTFSVDNYKGEHVYISYTYSRPATERDSLFRSNRPMSGATEIPAAFFDEVRSLRDLKCPFDTVFNVDEMENDRILHWLMRSISIDDADLARAVGQGIVLLADAAHGAPILGGDGANIAIEDAIELTTALSSTQTVDLMGFLHSRLERWKTYVGDSETRLAKIHEQPASHL